MLLTVPISEELEVKLAAKAKAAGVDVSTYVATIVEQTVKASLSLTEISGTIADDFAKSGMTEDELSEFLEAEKHAMRTERRAELGG